MIKNYIKTAFRGFLRNKVSSVINLLGLTIGIVCTSLIYLFVHNELTYDRFHEKSDRIFRVVEISKSPDGDIRYFGQTAPPAGPALSEEFPEVEAQTRLFQFVGHLNFNIKETRLAERSWYMVDPNFLRLFDFELLHGDRATALAQPNSLVLTRSEAIRFFGHTDVVGRMLEESHVGELKITAVLEDPPENSHLQFKLLISHSLSDEGFTNYLNNWERYGAYSYVLLNESNNMQDLNAKLPGFFSKYWADHSREFYFQPLEDIYFNSDKIEFGLDEVKGEKFYLWLFMGTGIFLLLIASINYVNLSTANASKRAREIGMRKVAGASRGQLFFQFMAESLIIALLALLVSIGLIDLLLPYFNEITQKQFVLDGDFIGRIGIILFSFSIVIGVIGGIYPSLYLSRLKPVNIIKGDVSLRTGQPRLRQTLVVTQFTMSIIMIIGTLVVNRQLNHIRDKELGFNDEEVVVVDINSGNVRSNFQTMKNEFRKIPGVADVAASSRVPGEWKSITELEIPLPDKPEDSLRMYFMSFDEDMMGLYDLTIIEGSNFTGNRATDSTKIILNEKAVESMGLRDPVGADLDLGASYPFQVTGVVEDFHYQSLHQEVAPLIIGFWDNPVRVIDYFSLKLRGNNVQATMKEITGVHEQFDEVTPIESHFLSDQIDSFYKADQRMEKLFLAGAVLTIFIACLGLFGVASFMIERRKKEIGIRKAMGATDGSLFVTLVRSYMIRIMISLVIAIPPAWWLLNKWLNNFASRISFTADIYLLAGLIAIAIALLTISYNVFKASRLNPSSILKEE